FSHRAENWECSMSAKFGKAVAAGLTVLCIVATAANAGCEGRKTTGTVVGAGAGGVLGNVITHGSVIGTVGGPVVGGVAGHSIAKDNCASHRHYSYRHG